eukprot:TRINITY_DN4845_c0_g1_i1.p1 TRINITY_DN4845_c0_g1~~TRINITY_DN4845_c0_g1_i1.p1  ORF type:complete len:103 (-),score=0.19 TRINITY_DN4845_c0_g1_i1:88-396(-)
MTLLFHRHYHRATDLHEQCYSVSHCLLVIAYFLIAIPHFVSSMKYCYIALFGFHSLYPSFLFVEIQARSPHSWPVSVLYRFEAQYFLIFVFPPITNRLLFVS